MSKVLEGANTAAGFSVRQQEEIIDPEHETASLIKTIFIFTSWTSEMFVGGSVHLLSES